MSFANGKNSALNFQHETTDLQDSALRSQKRRYCAYCVGCVDEFAMVLTTAICCKPPSALDAGVGGAGDVPGVVAAGVEGAFGTTAGVEGTGGNERMATGVSGAAACGCGAVAFGSGAVCPTFSFRVAPQLGVLPLDHQLHQFLRCYVKQ